VRERQRGRDGGHAPAGAVRRERDTERPFEAPLDVSTPQTWKPTAAAHRYATELLGAAPSETLLVAVHPWDIDGTHRAGLRTAWLRRRAAGYPAVMTPSDRSAHDLRDLARILAESN
jgi:2-haloacid dehalogenase